MRAGVPCRRHRCRRGCAVCALRLAGAPGAGAGTAAGAGAGRRPRGGRAFPHPGGAGVRGTWAHRLPAR
ncbi:hypothetical protein EXH46_14640 [Pelomonas puraquae]|nr:hypothetical protein [Roseateles puraquae]